MKKTNAIRILEKEKIEYDRIEYDPDSKVDGKEIAEKAGLPLEKVYKTLVTESKEKNHYVFLVPVNSELDLKEAAKIVNEKNISMLHQKDLYPLTGYIRGGVSPIGMKKSFKTIIDTSASLFEEIYVSAGQKGMQIKVNPNDLLHLIEASYGKVKKDGKDEGKRKL